jgi:hypothetical protein
MLFAARCFPALNRMFDRWAEMKNGTAGGSSVAQPAE